jgi:hypothetical protein
MRHAHTIAILGAIALALLFAFAPKIPQSQAYHAFADARTLIDGVPNTLNVLSNVAFVIAGAMGLVVLRAGGHFANGYERRDAVIFFVGTFLTAAGSAFYHLRPNDARLVYDRGGMVVAFMAFLAMLVHERFDGAAWLLPALLILGAASIAWWRAFDDLRPYAWVQFFPMLALVALVILDEPRHSGEVAALTAVFVSYAAAKLFEHFDAQTYEATMHIVSGHTLKHVAAACAPAAVALWIRRRTSMRGRGLG